MREMIEAQIDIRVIPVNVTIRRYARSGALRPSLQLVSNMISRFCISSSLESSSRTLWIALPRC